MNSTFLYYYNKTAVEKSMAVLLLAPQKNIEILLI